MYIALGSKGLLTKLFFSILGLVALIFLLLYVKKN